MYCTRTVHGPYEALTTSSDNHDSCLSWDPHEIFSSSTTGQGEHPKLSPKNNRRPNQQRHQILQARFQDIST